MLEWPTNHLQGPAEPLLCAPAVAHDGTVPWTLPSIDSGLDIDTVPIRGTQGESSLPDASQASHPLPVSLSEVCQTLMAAFKAIGRTEWALSPRVDHMSRVGPSPRKPIFTIGPLSRRHASRLTQLPPYGT